MPDETRSQLNRIAGQIGGIQRMLDENRDCLEILQQVIAARAALAAVGTRLLEQDVQSCLLRQDTDAFKKKIPYLFKLS